MALRTRRKVGESVRIETPAGPVVVTVERVDQGKVSLAVEKPPEWPVETEPSKDR
jgi:hypothetical protein